MRPRAWLVDLAGILLLAWAGLLGYVSLLTGWSFEDPVEGFVIVVGVVFAGSHLVAALGVFRRAPWARRLGLIVGGVGLVGTVLVVVTLVPGLDPARDVTGAWGIAPLAIPAAMAATYAVIVVALWRARGAFPTVGS
jgi:hypothetical protein